MSISTSGIGEPEKIHTLGYEPRALVTFDEDSSDGPVTVAYVGVKDGSLVELRRCRDQAGAEWTVKQILPPLSASPRSPGLAPPRGLCVTPDYLYVGDEKGCLWRRCRKSTRRGWEFVPLTDAKRGATQSNDGPIEAIQVLRDGRLLVLGRERAFFLSESGHTDQVDLPTPGRWLVRGRADDFYAVCDDGRVVGLSHDLGPSALLLRAPTGVVAGGKGDDWLLAYSHELGVSFARKGPDGIQEVLVSGDRPVSALAVLKLYGDRRLVVALDGGLVRSARLRNQMEEMSRARWATWHRAPCPVLHVCASTAGKSSASRGSVLLFREDHAVVHLPVENMAIRREPMDAGEMSAVEVLEQWVQRYEGPHGQDVLQALRRAIESGGEGPQTHSIDVGRRTTRAVQRLSSRSDRSGDPASWIRIGRIAGGLAKYTVAVGSFSRKTAGLTQLVSQNKDRPLDASIYWALLRGRGCDAIAVLDLPSPVEAIVVSDGNLVVSLKRGGVMLIKDGGRRSRHASATRPVGRTEEGERSRILGVLPNGRLVVCLSPASRLGRSVLNLHPLLGEPAFALCVSPTGDLMVGLGGDGTSDCVVVPSPHSRSTVLRFRFPPNVEREARPISASRVGARRQRVVAYQRVGEHQILVAGGEDGVLRFKLDPESGAQTSAVWNERHLGSAITSGTSWHEGEAADLHVAVGTWSGDVFVLKFSLREHRLEARVRFRDCLFAPIRSMLRVEGPDPTLVVADAHGYLTRYLLRADDGTTDELAGRRAFYGLRERKVKLADEITRVTHSPTSDAVVAGCVEAGQACLRWVVFPPVRPADSPLDGARDVLASWGFERPAHVLRAIPLDDHSLRAAVLEEEVRRAGAEEAGEVIRVAVAGIQDWSASGRIEFKALLNGVRAHVLPWRANGAVGDEGLKWYEAVSVHLDAPDGQWNRSPKARAAMVRKLLCRAAVHRDVRQPSRDPMGSDTTRLEERLSRLLGDAEPLVRLETLQGIASVLKELWLDPEAERWAVFNATDGSGAFAGAIGILRPLARFLAANPPSSGYSSECSTHTWTAMIAVRHFLCAFPGEVWVACDHMSISGVSGACFAILRRMLPVVTEEEANRRVSTPASTADRLRYVSAKLQLYHPWPAPSVEIEDAVRFLRAVRAVPRQPPGGDREFQEARRAIYGHIEQLFDATTSAKIRRTILAERRARVRPRPSVGVPAPPEQLVHMGYTAAWLDRFAAAVTRPDASVLANLPFGRGPTEKRLAGLFEPERQLVECLILHWRSALSRPVLVEGDIVGGYVVGRPLDPSDTRPDQVHRARRVGDPPRHPTAVDPSHVVRFTTTPASEKVRSAIVGRWEQVQRITIGVPQVPLVVERELCVVMVMEFGGRPLSAEIPSGMNRLVADAVLNHVSLAILALHDARMAHGDVKQKNIVWHGDVGEIHACLVDFGGLALGAPPIESGQNATTLMYEDAYARAPFEWWLGLPAGRPERVHERGLEGDVLGLAEAVANLQVRGEPGGGVIELARRVRLGHRGAVHDWFADADATATQHPFARLVRRELLDRVEVLRVFLSYTLHGDGWVCRELLPYLQLLDQVPGVRLFIDSGIRSGQDWQSEILREIEDADLFVLVFGADYLQRPFIRETELPAILKRKGARRLPVPLKPLPWEDTLVASLMERQAVWRDVVDLTLLAPVERVDRWLAVQRALLTAVRESAERARSRRHRET